MGMHVCVCVCVGGGGGGGVGVCERDRHIHSTISTLQFDWVTCEQLHIWLFRNTHCHSMHSWKLAHCITVTSEQLFTSVGSVG